MAELPIEDWHDFYLTTGAGAAAILGATFVVATLVSNVRERSVGLKGFITPTAVHLASVFTGSAILLMPTLDVFKAIAFFFLGGCAGVVYCAIVWTRIRHMKIDVPDRLWYAALPVLCYAAFAAGAVLIWQGRTFAFELFGIAFVALMVIGVRNAWDMATFMIMRDDSKPPAP